MIKIGASAISQNTSTAAVRTIPGHVPVTTTTSADATTSKRASDALPAWVRSQPF